MERQSSRKEWAEWEDLLITELVRQHGNKTWAIVAGALPMRTGKQCRERWHNHLDPAINKGEWTEEEDLQLIEVHRAMGNRWADIAKAIDGRTDNQIKNRWNSALRRELRKLNRVVSKQPDLVKAMAAATAAVSAANSSSELKEFPAEAEAASSSPSAEGDDGPGLKRRQHSAALVSATSALVIETACTSPLELDKSLSSPPGVSEADTRNAEQLLAHVAQLRTKWTAAPPPGPGGELSEQAAEVVGQHVDWLHAFCRQLVEQSLMLQRQPKPGGDESKRKRKRRSTKVDPPAPPPMAHAMVMGSLVQPAVYHQRLPQARPTPEVIPTARTVACLAPASADKRTMAALDLAGGGFDVNELLRLVNSGEGGMKTPPSSPREQHDSMTSQSHGGDAPSELNSPLSPYDTHYLSSGLYSSPQSDRLISELRFYGTHDEPWAPTGSCVAPGSRCAASPYDAPPAPAPRRCAPVWPAATPCVEEGIAGWSDDGEFDDSPLPRHKAAGEGAYHRPDGLYNLDLALCASPLSPSSGTSLGSGGSSAAEMDRGITTARLAALVSPSLLSPSLYDLLEARSVPSVYSPRPRPGPAGTVRCQ
jgi:hypothetical protein